MPIVNKHTDKTGLENGPIIQLAGRFSQSSNVLAHKHDFTEIIIITTGTCCVKTKDKSLYGSAGDLFVIPPNEEHVQIEKEHVATSYIGFYHLEDDFDSSFRVISAENELFMVRWFEDIIDMNTIVFNSDPYVEIVNSLLKAIITRIKQIEHECISNFSINPKLKKAIEFIYDNLSQPLSVEQIAGYVELSESHLTTLFRKNLGCGPKKYQQKQRLRLACRYLLDPYVTVKQAAQYSGYEDVNFFIRIFRKNYKVSPGHWRQKFNTSTF